MPAPGTGALPGSRASDAFRTSLNRAQIMSLRKHRAKDAKNAKGERKHFTLPALLRREPCRQRRDQAGAWSREQMPPRPLSSRFLCVPCGLCARPSFLTDNSRNPAPGSSSGARGRCGPVWCAGRGRRSCGCRARGSVRRSEGRVLGRCRFPSSQRLRWGRG